MLPLLLGARCTLASGTRRLAVWMTCQLPSFCWQCCCPQMLQPHSHLAPAAPGHQLTNVLLLLMQAARCRCSLTLRLSCSGRVMLGSGSVLLLLPPPQMMLAARRHRHHTFCLPRLCAAVFSTCSMLLLSLD